MYNQIGACVKCGAPIYCPKVWHSILPPPKEYSCSCGKDFLVTLTGTNTGS